MAGQDFKQGESALDRTSSEKVAETRSSGLRADTAENAWQKWYRERQADIDDAESDGSIDPTAASELRQRAATQFNTRPSGKKPPAATKPPKVKADLPKTGQAYFDLLKEGNKTKTDAEIEKQVRTQFKDFKLKGAAEPAPVPGKPDEPGIIEKAKGVFDSNKTRESASGKQPVSNFGKNEAKGVKPVMDAVDDWKAKRAVKPVSDALAKGKMPTEAQIQGALNSLKKLGISVNSLPTDIRKILQPQNFGIINRQQPSTPWQPPK